MNDTAASVYAERFGKVLDYIEQHLEEALSIERLSEVACFSKFHFHRQFSLYVGVSVSRYVQLMRLKRASHRLLFSPEARITDIALEAAFETPESFARAFKNAFGQTPSQFRQQPDWKPWAVACRLPRRERKRMMEVNIVDCEQTPVAVLEHRGDPALVYASVQRFIQWRKQSGLSPVASSRTFGLAWDDPDTTEPELYRFDICGAVSAPVPANAQGVVNKVIPGGRCAVVRHLGSHERIGESAAWALPPLAAPQRRGTAGFPAVFPLCQPQAGDPGARVDHGYLSAAEMNEECPAFSRSRILPVTAAGWAGCRPPRHGRRGGDRSRW